MRHYKSAVVGFMILTLGVAIYMVHAGNFDPTSDITLGATIYGDTNPVCIGSSVIVRVTADDDDYCNGGWQNNKTVHVTVDWGGSSSEYTFNGTHDFPHTYQSTGEKSINVTAEDGPQSCQADPTPTPISLSATVVTLSPFTVGGAGFVTEEDDSHFAACLKNGENVVITAHFTPTDTMPTCQSCFYWTGDGTPSGRTITIPKTSTGDFHVTAHCGSVTRTTTVTIFNNPEIYMCGTDIPSLGCKDTAIDFKVKGHDPDKCVSHPYTDEYKDISIQMNSDGSPIGDAEIATDPETPVTLSCIFDSVGPHTLSVTGTAAESPQCSGSTYECPEDQPKTIDKNGQGQDVVICIYNLQGIVFAGSGDDADDTLFAVGSDVTLDLKFEQDMDCGQTFDYSITGPGVSVTGTLEPPYEFSLPTDTAGEYVVEVETKCDPGCQSSCATIGVSVTVIELTSLTLTDRLDSSNKVTRVPGGPAETLYVRENASGSAIVDLECEWLPVNVPGNEISWQVELPNGIVPDPNPWSPGGREFASAGSPGTDSTTWTNPDPNGAVVREFNVRVWLDTDGDDLFDSTEISLLEPVTVVRVGIDATASPDTILRGGDAAFVLIVEPSSFTPEDLHLKVFDDAEQIFQDLNVDVDATEAVWDGVDYRGWNDYATEGQYTAEVRWFYACGPQQYWEDTIAVSVAELTPVWLEFTSDQSLKDLYEQDTRHADGAHWKRDYGSQSPNPDDVKHAAYHFGDQVKADVRFSAGIGAIPQELAKSTEVQIWAEGSAALFGSPTQPVDAIFKAWPSVKTGFTGTDLVSEIHYYKNIGDGWIDDSFRFDWEYRVRDSKGSWGSWVIMKNNSTYHYMCVQRGEIQTFALYEQIIKWGCEWAEGLENNERAINLVLYDGSVEESGLRYGITNPGPPHLLAKYLAQGGGMCGSTSYYLRYICLTQGVDSRSVFYGPKESNNWEWNVMTGVGLGGAQGPGKAAWPYFVNDNLDNPEWAYQADTSDIDYKATTTYWYFKTKPYDGHVVNWCGDLYDLSFEREVEGIYQPSGDQSYDQSASFRTDYFDEADTYLGRDDASCHIAGDPPTPTNEDLCLKTTEIPTVIVNFEDISPAFGDTICY